MKTKFALLFVALTLVLSACALCQAHAGLRPPPPAAPAPAMRAYGSRRRDE